MKKAKFRFDMRRKFFTLRDVRHWNRLPRELVDTPVPAVLKTKQRSSGRCPFPWLGRWDYEIFKVPFSP